MTKRKSVCYELSGVSNVIEIEVADNVFLPTKTSNLLISSILKSIHGHRRTLDLGCGSGYIGIVLAKMGIVSGVLHASDRSPDAVSCCIQNAKSHKIDCDARVGDLFDCWRGEKFELIVDTVSGVAEQIADKSTWFPGASHCGAGKDGTELTMRMLEVCVEHLVSDGLLVFPVLSLSNTRKIILKAEEMFRDVNLLVNQYFPVSVEMGASIDLLLAMAGEDLINIKKIGEKWVWWISIYSANNPI